MMDVKSNYKLTELGEIPNDWEVYPLKEIVLKIGDGNYSSKYPKKDDFIDFGIPFLRANNLKKGKLSMKDMRYISLEQHNTLKKGHIKVDDIIITVRGQIGNVAITTKEFDDVNMNAQLAFLRFNDQISAKFVLYFFQTTVLQNWLFSITTGTALQQLPINRLKNINIIIPPLKEQQKIAKILSTVDEQIEQTDQLIEKTKELKKGLMQHLLTNGIGHTEFKKTDLGKIPIEWNIFKIDEVARVIRGASPRPKGDIRYYGGDIPRLMIADITRDGKYVTPSIDFLTEEGAKKSRPMSKGAFVIACSGTYVGYPSILNVDACIHDGIISLLDYQDYLVTDFLYYIFIGLYNELNASATHGGVFNNLTTQIIREFKIKLPPLQEQQKIAEILSSVDEEIEGYQEERATYLVLKKGLIQQLLTGKTRVKVD